ncbi:SET domain-containing protein [Dactylosporangium salmoneum]|uniref:SET domain-containing protein n=1 Tax=Dactylosporangium salmoneum TaxID=53361 RepID=UPI0031E2E119
MDEVTIGRGALAGRGVYAARDFAAGEVVVAYRLRPLDEDEYRALPPGEDLFVHSYGGRRYLYPPPARFVNHADDPSCYQDFERGCDVARRPIAKGEPVTIDAAEETAHELGTFLDALRAGPARDLPRLVAAGATLWRRGAAARGRDAVVTGLTDEERAALTDAEWLVGTGRWEALCSARAGTAHLSLLLKVIAGNWQLVYLHVG